LSQVGSRENSTRTVRRLTRPAFFRVDLLTSQEFVKVFTSNNELRPRCLLALGGPVGVLSEIDKRDA